MATLKPPPTPGDGSWLDRPNTPGGERASHWESAWIDMAKIESFLLEPCRIVCCVDGSDHSACGLKYATESLLRQDKESFVQVMHVYKSDQSGLPPAWRSEALRTMAEAQLTSTVLPSRYGLTWVHKLEDKSVGVRVVEEVARVDADFVCMGFYGRKGRMKKRSFASNCMEVMQRAMASCIIIQNDDLKNLPIGRPTRFVVSVSLNAAATKAFFDALKLSKAGDDIHVVYIKSYMERTDSDYTTALRRKYASLFEGLSDGKDAMLSKFGGRTVRFTLVDKEMRVTTAQAVAQYADEVDADFLVVGTNAMRTARGKPHLGSVSLQVVMETGRNTIVSNYAPPAGAGERKESAE